MLTEGALSRARKCPLVKTGCTYIQVHIPPHGHIHTNPKSILTGCGSLKRNAPPHTHMFKCLARREWHYKEGGLVGESVLVVGEL